MASKDGVFISPIARDPSDIPCVSLGDYLMNHIRKNRSQTKGQIWVHDVVTGRSINYDDIEDLSMRIGSALTRHGFKKGDVLFYVTFDVSMLFLINMTVWRLGGITRGWYQYELQEFYTTLMKQSRIKYVLIDKRTANVMMKAIAKLNWPVKIFSFDDLEGTISVNELLEDDGSAFPTHVDINPLEDVAVIMCTSGTTGDPKGVLHTHYNGIAFNHGFQEYFFNNIKSILSPIMNFAVGNFMLTLDSIRSSGTIYYISKLDRSNYFDILMQYKPDMIMMYSYTAAWFARAPQLKALDLSFLKVVRIGAAVLDIGTLQNIRDMLPNVRIEQSYGQTETLYISSSKLGTDVQNLLVVTNKKDNNPIVSTGKLLPYVKAKVVDIDTRKTLPPGEQGEILVKTPYFMLGYFREDQKIFCDVIDEDGWIKTGDLGFINADGDVFIIERISTYFKYNAYPVVPTEIEAVLQTHEAVESAAVVGIPNIGTDNLARAFVVLRPGYDVCADDLKNYVADRLPEMKHLHGGVRFINALPENRNGKLDRISLKKYAIDSDTK